MSTDAPTTPPKKRRDVFMWLAGIVLVLFVAFVVQLVGPSPRLVASKETTFITEPLIAPGVPDYEEYVLRRLREGITPENNAAVLLFPALWPANLDPEHYDVVANELGLNEIPSAESALQPMFGDAMRTRVLAWLPRPAGSSEEPDADGIVEGALDHPWTNQQFPPLAEWVEANQKPLDQIVEASRRTRLYSPSPTLLNDRHDMLIMVLLPGTHSMREAAIGLKARAMFHIGENRLAEAWQDIMAMFRLGDLVAQGPTLVEQLVAIAIRQMACETTVALLSNEQLENDLAQQVQNDLATVAPFDNVVKCIDETDRISTLDSLVYARIYGFDAWRDSRGTSDGARFENTAVDWNVVLKRVNYWYDRAVAATRLPNGEARQNAFADHESALKAEEARVKQPGQGIAAFFSRTRRSELIGAIMACLMLPAIEMATDAEDRVNSLLSLTQTAAALGVYRSTHRAYPERLDALVPTLLKTVPVDSYRTKPIVYKRYDDGFLLYAVGPNGRDDGGSNQDIDCFEGQLLENRLQDEIERLREKIPSEADDYSIRLPVSLFKLPGKP